MKARWLRLALALFVLGTVGAVGAPSSQTQEETDTDEYCGDRCDAHFMFCIDRVDGNEKARGGAGYPQDVECPAGCLHAATVCGTSQDASPRGGAPARPIHCERGRQ